LQLWINAGEPASILPCSHAPLLPANTVSAVKEERRMLIVDDDRDSTHLLKILLEKNGGYMYSTRTTLPKLIGVPTTSGRT